MATLIQNPSPTFTCLNCNASSYPSFLLSSPSSDDARAFISHTLRLRAPQAHLLQQLHQCPPQYYHGQLGFLPSGTPRPVLWRRVPNLLRPHGRPAVPARLSRLQAAVLSRTLHTSSRRLRSASVFELGRPISSGRKPNPYEKNPTNHKLIAQFFRQPH